MADEWVDLKDYQGNDDEWVDLDSDSSKQSIGKSGSIKQYNATPLQRVQDKIRNWALQQPELTHLMTEQAGSDASQAVRSYVNTATLGVPQLIKEKVFGIPSVQQDRPLGAFIGGGLGLTGGLAKGVVRGAAQIPSMIKQSIPFAKTIGGAIGGAIVGGVLPPEKDFMDWQNRKSQTGMGAGLGAAVPLAGSALKNIGKLLPKGAVQFADDIRGQLSKAKSDAVSKFGSRLEELSKNNPEKSVSLRELVNQINSNIDDYSQQAKIAFKSNPKFNKMLSDPTLADSVTLKDAQEIINTFNTKIPKNIKYTHLDILDTINDVKAAQLDAFSEMATARQEYAAFKQPYDLVKGQFKVGKLLGNIERNFNDPELRNAVNTLLPKEAISEMGGYRNTVKTLRAVKKYFPWALGAGAAWMGVRGKESSAPSLGE